MKRQGGQGGWEGRGGLPGEERAPELRPEGKQRGKGRATGRRKGGPGKRQHCRCGRAGEEAGVGAEQGGQWAGGSEKRWAGHTSGLAQSAQPSLDEPRATAREPSYLASAESTVGGHGRHQAASQEARETLGKRWRVCMSPSPTILWDAAPTLSLSRFFFLTLISISSRLISVSVHRLSPGPMCSMRSGMGPAGRSSAPPALHTGLGTRQATDKCLLND